MKYAVFDLDKTIIKCNSTKKFLNKLAQQNKITKSQKTKYTLLQALSSTRVIPQTKVVNHLLKITNHLTKKEIEHSADAAFSEMRHLFFEDALVEIQKLKEKKYTIILATASTDYYAEKFKELLKLNKVVYTKNMFLAKGNLGKICFGKIKTEQVKKIVSENNEIICYSDSLDDTSLLNFGELGYFINPNIIEQIICKYRGWKVKKWRQTTHL